MNIRNPYKYRGRIRVEGMPACYHCVSRVAGGERLLKNREKEVFRRMLRKQAAFCGVEVITFAIMSNHFHLLVRVVPQEDLTDAELVERVRGLYGDEDAQLVAERLENEASAPALRKSLLARMGDVSNFLKELKQRFSIWYNNNHERFGTLWAERFKSVLVQGEDHALAVVAAYIDLNPVRAGLCNDPKDYRFCGYAEAVAGDADARKGLMRIFLGAKEWRKTQSAYRLVLFGKGYHTGAGKNRISAEALQKVLREKGELSLSDCLRCRMRCFSDGLAIGSAEFVKECFDNVKDRFGWEKKSSEPRPFVESPESELHSLSRMRGQTCD